MRETERQIDPYLTNNLYLRLCLIAILSLWLSLSCFCAYAADNNPVSVTLHEGLGKELEDSLLKAEKEGRLIDYYIEKESQFRDQGKYGEIIEMSNWVEKHIPKDNTNGITLIYELRSAAYSSIGDYQAMFEDIEKSLDLPKDKNLLFRDGILYLWLMDYHLTFDRSDLGERYLDKAKEIVSNHIDSECYKNSWNNLNHLIHIAQGQIYSHKNDWEAANYEYKEAEKYIQSDRHRRGLIMHKFAHYKSKGDFALADSLYRNYLFEDNQIPFLEMGNMRMQYVGLLLKMDRIENAKEVLRKIKPDSIHIFDRPNLYVLTSDIYKIEGNYQLAYHYLNKSIILRDSLESEYKSVYAKHAGDRYEIRQVEKSLEKQRLENIHNIILIIIFGLALIAAAVWIVIVIRHHRKRKRDQLIAETNLGNRNAALSSAVMTIDNYKNVCQDIKSILSCDWTSEQKIAEINRCLKESNNMVAPLHQVSNTNDESMQEFMDKLCYVHPDLTNAELRMAQLIFMNISNKDIAEMQNRSLGTIKNQKYSLRKKLATELPMEQYLKQLSAASPSELEELAKKK